ncbi:MAG: Hsp70 family protein [Aeromicrobium sp.]
MSYTLGVDLGTTFTAAAVDDGSGPVPLKLGSGADPMPSVVAIRDGAPLTGDEAEAVLRTSPASGVREAKRRLGDSTPFIIDGTPYGAEAVMGLLLADVIKAAVAKQGSAPASVVLAHPANWGEFKKDLLSDAARVAGLEDIGLITEPQAAAIHYVRSGELQIGQAAAIYDFGGGTFDAAVVRCAEDGPQLLGEAKGMERLGGIDLDQAILMHVNEAVGGALRELNPSDPASAAAMASIRTQCIAAKEALSVASEATISVAAPGLSTEVRLTRGEFEAMVRPRIADTLNQLDAALDSAGLSATDLSAVVLVGGTSRIPLVAEMVAAHTGVKVVASSDQKLVVCGGAAASDAVSAAQPESQPAVTSGGGAFVVTGPKPAESGSYGGGVSKRKLALIGGASVLAAGIVVGGAAAAGATPADALSALGLGHDPGDPNHGGPAHGMQAAHLDEFSPAPAAAGDGPQGPAGSPSPDGGGHAMGGSPMARAAVMSHRGGVAPHHVMPHQPGGGGDSPGAGMDHSGPMSPAPVDPEFQHTKDGLLANIQKWQPPAGVDAKTADAFRAELIDRIQRFHPMPGESAEHALAAMKDEYQDQVKDFVQDQRIADLVNDDAKQDAQATAIEAQLSDAKAKLLAGLENYQPPPGTNAADFAAMRADVEGLISRYHPVPGQTAQEALADLRYQYGSRVHEMAQDMKIEGVADDLSRADDNGNAPTTVTNGETTITYGPAYVDHITNPPHPNVTENPDGSRTVTFLNEQGRQVTIHTTEQPDAAIIKYRESLPPAPDKPEFAPPPHNPLLDHIFPWRVGDVPEVMDLAHQSLGFPPLIKVAPVADAMAGDAAHQLATGAGPVGVMTGPPVHSDVLGVQVDPVHTDAGPMGEHFAPLHTDAGPMGEHFAPLHNDVVGDVPGIRPVDHTLPGNHLTDGHLTDGHLAAAAHDPFATDSDQREHDPFAFHHETADASLDEQPASHDDDLAHAVPDHASFDEFDQSASAPPDHPADGDADHSN